MNPTEEALTRDADQYHRAMRIISAVDDGIMALTDEEITGLIVALNQELLRRNP